jgi:uncharacterized protein (DUF433 family)
MPHLVVRAGISLAAQPGGCDCAQFASWGRLGSTGPFASYVAWPYDSAYAAIGLTQIGDNAMPRPTRIEVNPKVMLGKPVIRGTRIPVELVLRKLGEGASEAELLAAYPRLKRADIRAAQSYAADALAHEEVIVEPRRRQTAS